MEARGANAVLFRADLFNSFHSPSLATNKAFRGHSHPDHMLSGALTNQDPRRPPRRYQYKSPERHPQLPYRPSKDRRLCFDGADHLAGDYFGVLRNP